MSGAFLFLGGGVLAAAFNVAAQRSERPSEIALFLGLTRIAVVMIAFGALLTLVLGFWLVSDQDFSFSELWVVLSLILWFVAIGMGQAGGMRDRDDAPARRASSRPARTSRRPSCAPACATRARSRSRLRQRPRRSSSSSRSWSGSPARDALVQTAQLFLHILGAITLFGATSAVAVLALFGRNREEQLPLARGVVLDLCSRSRSRRGS